MSKPRHPSHEPSPAVRFLPLLSTAICLAALSSTGAALAQAPGSGAGPRMKAFVRHAYGSPDVLRLEEVEKPVPKDDELLVRVRAASVNPLDWHYMRGEPFVGRFRMGFGAPKVARLGVDFAGTVESVGRSVTRFKPGDDVFGGRMGAFAEYLTVPQDGGVAPKPANVTFEQAAAVPIAAVTALQGLRQGKVGPGQRVLVNGASGGVGTFEVQIAKAFGAQVTGVCSGRNAELVRSIGADRVIDYTKEDFTKGGERWDVILDNVGNHSLLECRRALTATGRYVMVGAQSGRWIDPLRRLFRVQVFSQFVSQGMSMLFARIDQRDLMVLRDWMEAGTVTPVVDRRYPLGQLPDAVRYLETGHARGKVVITVGSDEAASPMLASPATPSPGAIAPEVTALAVLAVILVAPGVAALALNRRFQRRNPEKRPYRWGYYVAILSLLGGIGLGLLLELGAAAVVGLALVYGALAWSFGRRRRWAWVALTILTFNPVAWLVNAIYLRRRWTEDAMPAHAG